MRFHCRTLFDITATGVTGHYKSTRVPFQDRANQQILNERDWNRSRNQQRNWETITQLLSMRTQIFQLKTPIKNNDAWEFEFEVETPAVFGPSEDPVQMLIADAAGVPMMVGLENILTSSQTLIVSGEYQNIWFSLLT